MDCMNAFHVTDTCTFGAIQDVRLARLGMSAFDQDFDNSVLDFFHSRECHPGSGGSDS